MPLKRVFIVEDDTDISELLEIIVKNAGFATEVFLELHNVEKKIIEQKPNLVIMDLFVGELDSTNLVKKLKKTKGMEKIPIIIVSAKNALPEIAKSAGADDFLAKPFNVKDLNTLLKKFL